MSFQYIDKNCQEKKVSSLSFNHPLSLSGNFGKYQHLCYYFSSESGEKITLKSNTNIVLINPDQSSYTTQGLAQIELLETGIYSIIIQNENNAKNYQVSVNLVSPIKKATSNYIVYRHQHQMRLVQSLDYNDYKYVNGQTNHQLITYNLVDIPNWRKSEKLERIVSDMVNFVYSQRLPTDRLSISLIDLDSIKCCSYAGYSDREPRFPASVAKLFWMVYLFAEYKAGVIKPEARMEEELQKMIQDSNNESASLIVDTITGTTSGRELNENQLAQWLQKRLALNSFFERAGYSSINISQKVFPTSYARNDSPTGRDLQIRLDEINPVRNYVTTYDVARLLLEIEKGKSISPRYSRQMEHLLHRNLHPQFWQNKEYNAIAGFLGESLPKDAYFASKMGWNFSTRNDAAIIGSPNGKHKYILVVFGDDPGFYQNKQVFPQLSLMVYRQMVN